MHSSEIIGWFADIGLSDRPTVGGKGGSLGEMTRASIPVPPGFVVRTAAFERFLSALEKEEPIRTKVEALGADQLDEITELSKHLRARLESVPLPDDINSELIAAHAELCGANPMRMWQCALPPQPRTLRTPVLRACRTRTCG